jgi:hypothetical protein
LASRVKKKKKWEYMKTFALGYCGLNCEECPVFIATSNDDSILRQETAREWSGLYAGYLGKELKPEDMNCGGCRSQSNLFIGCMSCPIRKCSCEKNLISCALCDEYEKCEMLNGFFGYHHQQAKNNLDQIRKDAKYG